MTITEYRRYYLDLTLGVLGGNHGHFDITEPSTDQLEIYNNYSNGLIVLALVSFLDARFLSKSELKVLRNFEPVARIPSTIHQVHLSSYIYLRDCFAHNPFAKLLPEGQNTTAFLAAIDSGKFSFASVAEQRIRILDTNPLHRIILRLFEIGG